jgi:F-type H+-transporting ATPase subunit b
MSKRITVGLAFVAAAIVPMLALAAGGGNEPAHADYAGLIRHGINFLIFAGIMYLALRGPLSDFLNFRRAEVKDQLDKSLEAKTTAEAKYSELQGRLDNFESELSALQERVRTDAAAERETLLANAERSAKNLEAAAQRTIEEELRRARAELRAEAVDLSVKIAHELLTENITDDDQNRLTGDYLAKVEETARG